MSSSLDAPRPATQQDVNGWKRYWRTQGQAWRTEPEIDKQRQRDLARGQPHRIAHQGVFHPFKGEVLNRADIEWLLANHESDNIYGPVYLSNEDHLERMGINIVGANLANVDLSYLPLTRMHGSVSSHGSTSEQHMPPPINLDSADLTGTHLEEAYLIGAQMSNAHLTGAYLKEALLVEAHLEDVFFNEADLEQADLAASQVSRAHFIRAHFIRAHLERATLREAHMEDASFNEAHLEGIDGRDAYISGASFNKAHLQHSDFRRARGDQSGVSFHLAFLELADFQEAHLENANFREAHLEGADLRGAHLEGADLRDAHLNGKRLSVSDLERIRKWPTSLTFPEIISPADLREVFFSSSTRLHGAILGDAEYGFVSIADVDWGDVNLNVINWEQVSQIGDERKARNPRREKSSNSIQKPSRDANQKKPKKMDKKIENSVLEDYHAAVRANRQLAIVLRNQGLNEAAACFSYRAQKLYQTVLRKERKWFHYLLSLLLDLLAGYGYRPLRSFIAYLAVVVVFMVVYRLLEPGLTWGSALVMSVATSGRGLLPGGPAGVVTDPIAYTSVIEAFIDLVIEVTFIAALTQRVFSK